MQFQKQEMKTILAQALIAFFPLVLASQAWSPIRVNQKMNYQHSDSSYVSHTIWVDSVAILAGDSILYLNRVVKDVQGNPEIALRNQPQFLLTRIHKIQNGIYTFELPDAFQFFTQAGVNEPWLLGTQNSLWATVESIIYENIFGTMDSVKYISLTDGSEIRLSKNFGFLKFPDFENNGYFELVGIQDSPYGVSVPDFWDIYNFEVGDVFQYHGSGYYADQWVYNFIWTEKIQITSKEVFNDSIKYGFSGILNWINWGKSPSSEIISGDFVFYYSENDLTNKFPNELVLFEGDNFWDTWDGPVFARTTLELDAEINRVIKKFGYVNDGPAGGALYAQFDPQSDSLHAYYPFGLIDEPGGIKTRVFITGLGLVRENEGYFEYEDEMHLEGYIKDGDTVGIITPDSLLLSNEQSIKISGSKILIYPNPVSDVIQIKLEAPQPQGFDFELRNSLGQLVRRVEDIRSKEFKINIEDLKTGLYIYGIFVKNQTVGRGKLLIR